jgi:hypothetical protein
MNLELEPQVPHSKAVVVGHLTPDEVRTIAARIDPAFYDIELEGADEAKADFLQRLTKIFNYILDRRYGRD